MKRMKPLLCLVLGLVICLFTGSNSAFAATSNSEKISALPKIQITQELRDTFKELKEAQSTASAEGVRSSAPPLTYLEVYAACSSQYPNWEYFSEDQVYSVQDHGGDEMYIVTAELGYGSTRFARMNGSLLSSYNVQYIDLDGDSVIDGFFYYWDASGYQGGNFTYENTSSNYPWNNMSDSIRIR